MKTVEKIILSVGLAAFVIVAWRMPWDQVIWALRGVGPGFLFIFSQEIVAHVLNTLGWWAAFLPEHREVVPSFGRLLRLRIAGDGVNYLIPSAIVAGEVAKASMIGGSHSISKRVSSLVVSKFTQLLAFALICAASFLLIFRGRVSMPALDAHLAGGLALLALMLLWLLAYKARTSWKSADGGHGTHNEWAGVGRDALGFLERHPVRFLLSTGFFSLAYLWGAFEAYWIAFFLGLPITVETALIIEILSISVDAIFFMVPAKAGSQEVGKTAIFAALGLPKTAGFAFGLVRHAREILWAVIGLGLFYSGREPKPIHPAHLDAGSEPAQDGLPAA